jgi:hypothetical protein
MISSANFNPLHPKALSARQRLRNFHEIVASQSVRVFPTLVLNDGAIAYRDLSYRTASVTYDFLQRCWKLFNAIQEKELASGHPGVRMVVAVGFRIKGRRGGLDSTASQFQSLIDRLKKGLIDSAQAIHEARRIRPYFDVLPQLQANFAFTKAYVAEQSGTKGGLGGAKLFVDLALFDDRKLEWIQLGPPIRWKHSALNLQADFAPLLKMTPHSGPEPSPLGLRNGLQVAQHLAGDQDVLSALRAATK